MSKQTEEKTESAAAPKRNVRVKVIKSNIKLPDSNHRLGIGHVTTLTVDEAKTAEQLGHVKITGTI